jgi:hypothetical protein
VTRNFKLSTQNLQKFSLGTQTRQHAGGDFYLIPVFYSTQHVTLAISESFQFFSLSRRKSEVTDCHVRPKPRHTEQQRLRPLVLNEGICMDRTTQAVRQQIEAMGAQVFEAGLFKPSAADGGGAVMIPRTWDASTLVRSLPWLRLQNADGRNIYVRPKGEHDLTLVDDLTAAAIGRMKAEGFAPAVVVETSPGNFQAWLKHPTQLTRDLSTMAARKLAEEFGGDRGAADWRHFGRLAGFTNRKPKYVGESGLFPFVRLIEATGVKYSEGERLMAAISAEREAELDARQSHLTTRMIAGPGTTSKSIDDFRSNPRYGGDATREDLAFAIYALSHGSDAEHLAAVLRNRDLSHKGTEKRQNEYIQRTITKAATMAGGKCRV